MNRAELIFAVVDYACHIPQNYKFFKDISSCKNIAYDSHPLCQYDIYYRKTNSDKKMPVIFNIHGGGFVKGDKKHRRSLSEMYADKGYFVVNANYRLAPKAAFPTHIQDLFKALAQLPTLAEEYNLDLTKVIFTGDSSGAHAATTMVAALFNEELHSKLQLTKVDIKPAGLIAFSGFYDVTQALSRPIPFSIAWSVAQSISGLKDLKKDFSNMSDFKLLDEINIINYVNEKWCPVLLSWSNKDIFCPGQGEKMKEVMESHNLDVVTHNSTSLLDNHCYHFNYWAKKSKEVLALTFEFMKKIAEQ
ncbi:MAG: alpha/beta hydrolase [Bacillota bacterium]